MTTTKHRDVTRTRQIFALVACASTALSVVFLFQNISAHAAEKNLTDLRLYNFKAANPGASTSTSSSSSSSSKTDALSSSAANMLDDANNTDGAIDATTTATLKPKKAMLPDTGKALSVDAEDKMLNVQDDFGTQNRAELNVDNVKNKKNLGEEKTPGIPLGTFILRPSLTQSVNHESTNTSATATTLATTRTRGYLQTGFAAELISDWDLHELKVTSVGAFQNNIYGSGSTKPNFDINAALRLDISRDTTARLNAGYNYARIDTTDPNPIVNALVPAPLETWNAGASVEQKFGVIRGTVGLDLNRTVYGVATLASGANLSLADRNQTTIMLRGRLGYEISPVLIPFVEASVGRSRYDQTIDQNGYQRSGMAYALRAGVQFNPDEKLSGELAAGFETARFDDARLNPINALTLDGNATWSIQRGTDATFGLKTTIDPSTQAGVSGSVTYAANASVSHMLMDNLTARLKGAAAYRDYPDLSTIGDENILSVGAGLSWGINRYLDLTGDINYETTTTKTNNNTNVLTAGVGLKLKR